MRHHSFLERPSAQTRSRSSGDAFEEGQDLVLVVGDVQLGLPGEILVDDVRGRDSDLVTPVAHLADVAHDGVLGDDRRHAAFGQHVGRDVVIKLKSTITRL